MDVSTALDRRAASLNPYPGKRGSLKQETLNPKPENFQGVGFVGQGVWSKIWGASRVHFPGIGVS